MDKKVFLLEGEVLPEGPTTEEVTSQIEVFGFVQQVFIVIGIVILLIVVFRVAKAFAKGDMKGVAMTSIGGLIAAVLCFNLGLPIALIDNLGNVADSVFKSLGNIAGNGDGG